MGRKAAKDVVVGDWLWNGKDDFHLVSRVSNKQKSVFLTIETKNGEVDKQVLYTDIVRTL